MYEGVIEQRATAECERPRPSAQYIVIVHQPRKCQYANKHIVMHVRMFLHVVVNDDGKKLKDKIATKKK